MSTLYRFCFFFECTQFSRLSLLGTSRNYRKTDFWQKRAYGSNNSHSRSHQPQVQEKSAKLWKTVLKTSSKKQANSRCSLQVIALFGDFWPSFGKSKKKFSFKPKKRRDGPSRNHLFSRCRLYIGFAFSECTQKPRLSLLCTSPNDQKTVLWQSIAYKSAFSNLVTHLTQFHEKM